MPEKPPATPAPPPSNDALIDAYERAVVGHETAKAARQDLNTAWHNRNARESEMVGRFGIGEHLRRWKQRYPARAGGDEWLAENTDPE